MALFKKVRILKFIRYCSGVKNQAWYLADVGGEVREIRKPIQNLRTGVAATELKPASDLEILDKGKEPIELPKGTVFKNCERHEMIPLLKWWQRVWLFIVKLFRL